MLKQSIQTNFSIASLFNARDEAFHAALLALGRAYRARRLSDAKFETRATLLQHGLERAQTNAQIIMFVDSCRKIVEEFETV